MTVGQKLRSLRKQAKMGLKDLAIKSGVGLGTLSRIENDKLGPSGSRIETHRKICEALGVTLAELYRDLEQPTEADTSSMKLAAEEAETFTYDEKAQSILLAKQVLQKNMLPQLIVLQPGGKTHLERTRPGCEKWLFVLEGEVEVTVGEQRHALARHGTLYFKASVPHQLINPKEVTAQCISVTSPVGL